MHTKPGEKQPAPCRLAARAALCGLIAVFHLTAACSDDEYAVRVLFPSAEEQSRARVVEVYLLDICGPLGLTGATPSGVEQGGLPSLVFTVGEPTGRLGSANRGAYFLYARARDESCRFYAAGCEPVTLREDTSALLEVRVNPVDGPECEPGTVCVRGECRPGDCGSALCPDGSFCDDGICVPQCRDELCTNPGEVCQRGNCVPFDVDNDGDGATAQHDCDDYNDRVHPGADELCNGIDDNCDGVVDPDSPELCNGVDDDCDGRIDEDLGTRVCDAGCGPGEEVCEAGGWNCLALAGCECTPNGTEQTEDCGNCGSRTRTCRSGAWSDWGPCRDEHGCIPGATREGSCDDHCSHEVCLDNCTWECRTRPGNECEWQDGAHYRCCGGVSECQYCSFYCRWYSCSVNVSACPCPN